MASRGWPGSFIPEPTESSEDYQLSREDEELLKYLWENYLESTKHMNQDGYSASEHSRGFDSADGQDTVYTSEFDSLYRPNFPSEDLPGYTNSDLTREQNSSHNLSPRQQWTDDIGSKQSSRENFATDEEHRTCGGDDVPHGRGPHANKGEHGAPRGHVNESANRTSYSPMDPASNTYPAESDKGWERYYKLLEDCLDGTQSNDKGMDSLDGFDDIRSYGTGSASSSSNGNSAEDVLWDGSSYSWTKADGTKGPDSGHPGGPGSRGSESTERCTDKDREFARRLRRYFDGVGNQTETGSYASAAKANMPRTQEQNLGTKVPKSGCSSTSSVNKDRDGAKRSETKSSSSSSRTGDFERMFANNLRRHFSANSDRPKQDGEGRRKRTEKEHKFSTMGLSEFTIPESFQDGNCAEDATRQTDPGCSSRTSNGPLGKSECKNTANHQRVGTSKGADVHKPRFESDPQFEQCYDQEVRGGAERVRKSSRDGSEERGDRAQTDGWSGWGRSEGSTPFRRTHEGQSGNMQRGKGREQFGTDQEYWEHVQAQIFGEDWDSVHEENRSKERSGSKHNMTDRDNVDKTARERKHDSDSDVELHQVRSESKTLKGRDKLPKEAGLKGPYRRRKVTKKSKSSKTSGDGADSSHKSKLGTMEMGDVDAWEYAQEVLKWIFFKVKGYMLAVWSVFFVLLFYLIELCLLFLYIVCLGGKHLASTSARLFWNKVGAVVLVKCVSWLLFLWLWMRQVNPGGVKDKCAKVWQILRTLLNKFRKKKDDDDVKEKPSSSREGSTYIPSTGEDEVQRLLQYQGETDDFYSILGVREDSTDEEIKRQYKKLAVLVHPDKNPHERAGEAFQVLSNANFVIGDPEKRQQYDFGRYFQKQQEEKWTTIINEFEKMADEMKQYMACDKCGSKHKKYLMTEKTWSHARYCASCNKFHPAFEGDVWAESKFMGIKLFVYTCIEFEVYDITEWAQCQGLKPAADTHDKFGTMKFRPQGRGPSRPHPPRSSPFPKEWSDLYNNTFPNSPFDEEKMSTNPKAKKRGKRKKKR